MKVKQETKRNMYEKMCRTHFPKGNEREQRERKRCGWNTQLGWKEREREKTGVQHIFRLSMHMQARMRSAAALMQRRATVATRMATRPCPAVRNLKARTISGVRDGETLQGQGERERDKDGEALCCV